MEFAVEWVGKSKPNKKLMNTIFTICKNFLKKFGN